MPVVASFALPLSLYFHAEDIFVENEISLVQMQLVKPIRLHHGSASTSPRTSEWTRASENYMTGSNKWPRSPASCIWVWHVPNGCFTINIQGIVEVFIKQKGMPEQANSHHLIILSKFLIQSSMILSNLLSISTFGLHRTPKQSVLHYRYVLWGKCFS